jgi:hypothetical protein
MGIEALKKRVERLRREVEASRGRVRVWRGRRVVPAEFWRQGDFEVFPIKLRACFGRAA